MGKSEEIGTPVWALTQTTHWLTSLAFRVRGKSRKAHYDVSTAKWLAEFQLAKAHPQSKFHIVNANFWRCHPDLCFRIQYSLSRRLPIFKRQERRLPVLAGYALFGIGGFATTWIEGSHGPLFSELAKPDTCQIRMSQSIIPNLPKHLRTD